ncbi:MAG: hypothetical protein DRG83_09175 [Deltaproteobacteria bacterium]|nr:MAG: hypothetical protein DRG83_09175 [Deltaproteobacteria bacterium]
MLRKIIHRISLLTLIGVSLNAIYRGDVLTLSMIIFLLGVFYAVLERNIIVGLASLLAAMALPWVKSWLISYWPWVKEYCMSFIPR